jgi:hypothetical protein
MGNYTQLPEMHFIGGWNMRAVRSTRVAARVFMSATFATSIVLIPISSSAQQYPLTLTLRSKDDCHHAGKLGGCSLIKPDGSVVILNLPEELTSNASEQYPLTLTLRSTGECDHTGRLGGCSLRKPDGSIVTIPMSNKNLKEILR